MKEFMYLIESSNMEVFMNFAAKKEKKHFFSKPAYTGIKMKINASGIAVDNFGHSLFKVSTVQNIYYNNNDNLVVETKNNRYVFAAA